VAKGNFVSRPVSVYDRQATLLFIERHRSRHQLFHSAKQDRAIQLLTGAEYKNPRGLRIEVRSRIHKPFGLGAQSPHRVVKRSTQFRTFWQSQIGEHALHFQVRARLEISVAERQLVIAVRSNVYERLMIHLFLDGP
jgi:hypothetical protein